jgi:hypothetical protein
MSASVPASDESPDLSICESWHHPPRGTLAIVPRSPELDPVEVRRGLFVQGHAPETAQCAVCGRCGATFTYRRQSVPLRQGRLRRSRQCRDKDLPYRFPDSPLVHHAGTGISFRRNVQIKTERPRSANLLQMPRGLMCKLRQRGRDYRGPAGSRGIDPSLQPFPLSQQLLGPPLMDGRHPGDPATH